jgi:hypothetical protein
VRVLFGRNRAPPISKVGTSGLVPGPSSGSDSYPEVSDLESGGGIDLESRDALSFSS